MEEKEDDLSKEPHHNLSNCIKLLVKLDLAMGKVESDSTLVGQGSMQLRQLRSIIVQLRESRDTTEAMLHNLRSELSVLRKEQEEKEDPEGEESKRRAEILSLELIDAKNEILRLKSENAKLKSTAGEGYATSGAEDDKTLLTEDARKEMRRMKKKINKAVRQCEKLKKRKQDLEHELRTSRFREDEAVVFLRRIRSFYYMIWRNNVVRGSGGYVANRIQVVTSHQEKYPGGAADLDLMLEMDKLMLEAGLLEKDEVGKVTSDDKKPYRPTRGAFQRSNVATD